MIKVRWALVTAVSVLALIGATGLIVRESPPVVATVEAHSPSPSAAADAYTFGLACPADDKEFCAKIIADMQRRAPLLKADVQDVDAVSLRADEALTTVAATEQTREALADAGFDEVVIRPARAGDAAPIGSLLIAIGAGKACVIRIQQADAPTGYFAGRLPDGTCLNQ